MIPEMYDAKPAVSTVELNALEKLLGIAQGRKLPRFASSSFLRLAARRRLTKPTRRSGRKVLYFVDTYANYHDPKLAEAYFNIAWAKAFPQVLKAISNNHDFDLGQAWIQGGGPVAIGAILWGYSYLGISFVIMIIAVISLLLALMNVLPIPALDGGRLFMILISRGIF